MSLLRRRSAIFLYAKLSEELNSESPWADGAVPLAFHDDAFHALDGTPTTLDTSQIVPAEHLLPSFEDDHLGAPSTSSGGPERVDSVDPALDMWTMSYGVQYDDLYATLSWFASIQCGLLTASPPSSHSFDDAYRATHYELFHPEYTSGTPFPKLTTFKYPQPVPEDNQPTLQIPPDVGPSIVSTYPPYFNHSLEFSQTPPTPGNMNITSLPPSSPSSSSPSSPICGSTGWDAGGDADRTPPSSDDKEYHPAPAIPSKKLKKCRTVSRPRSSRRERFSSTNTSSSGPGSGSEGSASSSRVTWRFHPDPRLNTSSNFQRVDGSKHIDKDSAFHCTVVGCEYKQDNHRVRELRRHIEIHERWMEPDKWTCCGVGMDVAHLYDVGLEEGMPGEEFIGAGAYIFRGRLMIGGCMGTFSRRDALKRHVDNPKINCVGDMNPY